eukprot:scaffold8835_cov70-Cyclotella_meneghiniana.AAC.1
MSRFRRRPRSAARSISSLSMTKDDVNSIMNFKCFIPSWVRRASAVGRRPWAGAVMLMSRYRPICQGIPVLPSQPSQ